MITHPMWKKTLDDGSTIKLVGPLLPYAGYRDGRKYMIVCQLSSKFTDQNVGIIEENGNIEWRTDSTYMRESVCALLPELTNFISVDVIQDC